MTKTSAELTTLPIDNNKDWANVVPTRPTPSSFHPFYAPLIFFFQWGRARQRRRKQCACSGIIVASCKWMCHLKFSHKEHMRWHTNRVLGTKKISITNTNTNFYVCESQTQKEFWDRSNSSIKPYWKWKRNDRTHWCTKNLNTSAGEGRKPGVFMNPQVPTCIAFWPGEK